MQLKLKSTAAAAFAVLALAASGVAHAGPASVSGSYNGLEWTASKMLTGVFHTGGAGVPGGTAGNPLYHPTYPAYSGVVHMVMDFGGPNNQFICSGTLLEDRRSILTAGHCVSNGAGTANPLTTTIYFQPPGGLPPGTRIQTGGIPNGGAVTRNVSDYFVNSAYTGEVIDHNDVAILRMDDLAPDWAWSYQLYTNNNLTGVDMNVAGYGVLGDGATGSNNFAARLRQGNNTYDFSLGDAAFGGFWTDRDPNTGENFFGLADVEHSWLSDFDNGLAANDTACQIGQALGTGALFCDLGRGDTEVGVGGGDSGGPNFVGGMIAAVNSYGLSFGRQFGDNDAFLNSSFGEFSGYVPVYLHEDFIRSSMVMPIPGTLALVLGLGLVAPLVSKRRRLQ